MTRAFALVLLLASGTTAAAQSGGLRLEPIPETPREGEVLAPADWLSGAPAARDETSAGRAFVDVVTARTTGFVGEVIALEVRFGLDAQFLAEESIPPFRRKLDVPVAVVADWLEDAESLELTHAFAEPDAAQSVTCARNGRVARARRLPDRVVNGRTFRVYALDVRRVAHDPGVLRLLAPRVVYARGTAFTDDFVTGRVATERVDAFVSGREVEFAIEPLPEAGRPPEFSGAVGRFEMDARCDVHDEPGGTRARLELVLHGDGDLARALAPDGAQFPDFRVDGVLDDHGHARRRITLDLVRTRASTLRVPSVAFHFFDPTPPGRYAVARSEPIELPVSRAVGAPPRPPVRSTDTPPEEPGRLPGDSRIVLGGFGALLLVGILAAIFFVRRSGHGRAGGRDGGGK